MKKKNILIIGVVAFVLVLAVGFAIFSETITVTGTATAKGTFDVEFKSVGAHTGVGYTKQAGSADLAVISTDGNTLTVTVNKLDYPGAYVSIPVVIANTGSIDAKLTSITETGLTSTSPVKVSYTGVAKDAILAAGKTLDLTINVEWLESDESNNTNVTATFSVELGYEQVTV